MLMRRPFYTLLVFALLLMFSWAQTNSALHTAKHPFHKSSVYCDSLLAAAQPLHLATLAIFIPPVQTFHESPLLRVIQLIQATFWLFFFSRAPPL